MGDVSHFKNESVLSLIKNNIIMVGLNFSRPVSAVSEPFVNFATILRPKHTSAILSLIGT